MTSFEKWDIPEVDERCVNKKTLEDDLHAALNPNICEPVAPGEGIEEQKPPQGPEVGFINPNTIIDREESLSERLQGSARKAAKVMMLVTALSALPGLSKDAHAIGYAESVGRTERTEQVYRKDEQQSEKIKVTGASAWAGEHTKKALSDLKHIKTAQDAEWMVQLHVDGFADEFYSAPRNASGRSTYNTERVYTIDDAKYVIDCTKTLKSIMEDLRRRYSVGNYEKRQARLDAVISNLEQQTSYSFQKEQEARREVMKRFKMLNRY